MAHFDLCLKGGYGVTSWPMILIGVLTLLTFISSIIAIRGTINLKNFFPIKELSPKLTVFQIISIMFLSITDLFIIANSLKWEHKNQPTQSTFEQIGFQLIQLIMRGIFFFSTLFKVLRINISFKCDLKEHEIILNLLKSEFYQVITSMLLGSLIFVLPYVIYIFAVEQDQNILLGIEQVGWIGIFFNGLEILGTWQLANMNWFIYHEFEEFKYYISRPLIITVFMHCINMFLYLEPMECLSLQLLIMWILQYIRYQVTFILMIMLPLKNAKPITFPFTPSTILTDFNYMMKEEICANLFLEYLSQCQVDKQNLFINKSTYSLKSKDILLYYCDILMDQQNKELLNKQKYQNIWEIIAVEDEESIDNILKHVIIHLNTIYDENYRKTISFKTLEALFLKFDRANENFQLIGLNNEFFLQKEND